MPITATQTPQLHTLTSASMHLDPLKLNSVLFPPSQHPYSCALDSCEILSSVINLVKRNLPECLQPPTMRHQEIVPSSRRGRYLDYGGHPLRHPCRDVGGSCQYLSLALAAFSLFFTTLAYSSTGMYANSIYIWLPLTLVGDVGAVLEAHTLIYKDHGPRISEYIQDIFKRLSRGSNEEGSGTQSQHGF